MPLIKIAKQKPLMKTFFMGDVSVACQFGQCLQYLPETTKEKHQISFRFGFYSIRSYFMLI